MIAVAAIASMPSCVSVSCNMQHYSMHAMQVRSVLAVRREPFRVALLLILKQISMEVVETSSFFPLSFCAAFAWTDQS